MSVDSILDAAFTTLLLKAQQDELPVATRPIVIGINFSLPPPSATTAAPLTFPAFPGFTMVPSPTRLVSVVMFALNDHLQLTSVTAQIDLRVTSVLASASTLANADVVYGQAGGMPSLSNAAVAVIDTTNWKQNFTTGDILLFNLYSYTGLATVVGLLILLRPTDVPQGVDQLVDSTGSPMVDSNGNPMVLTN